MKAELKISGIGKLRKRFVDTRKKASSVSYVVGYTAAYALAVHEIIPLQPQWGRSRSSGKGAYWDPVSKGQPKFLEQPARELEGGKIIAAVVNKGGSLEDGLKVAALKLQRDSQELVPVDTGGAGLKGSAFTRKE